MRQARRIFVLTMALAIAGCQHACGACVGSLAYLASDKAITSRVWSGKETKLSTSPPSSIDVTAASVNVVARTEHRSTHAVWFEAIIVPQGDSIRVDRLERREPENVYADYTQEAESYPLPSEDREKVIAGITADGIVYTVRRDIPLPAIATPATSALAADTVERSQQGALVPKGSVLVAYDAWGFKAGEVQRQWLFESNSSPADIAAFLVTRFPEWDAQNHSHSPMWPEHYRAPAWTIAAAAAKLNYTVGLVPLVGGRTLIDVSESDPR